MSEASLIEEIARVAESYQNERGKVYVKPQVIADAIRAMLTTKEGLLEYRGAIIEECAREAETFAGPVARNIAAVIRTLKDKA